MCVCLCMYVCGDCSLTKTSVTVSLRTITVPVETSVSVSLVTITAPVETSVGVSLVIITAPMETSVGSIPHDNHSLCGDLCHSIVT